MNTNVDAYFEAMPNYARVFVTGNVSFEQIKTKWWNAKSQIAQIYTTN